MNRFIKFNPDSDLYLSMMASGKHREIILLSCMAIRARRTDDPVTGLKVGQCFLGDIASMGMTEKQYRTAKKNLEKFGLASFKGANKGTVGTLLNSDIYDINATKEGGQGADKGRTEGGQGATNKNVKNDKKGKNTYTDDFENAWAEYPKREGNNPKPSAFKAWNARISDGHTPDQITEGVRRYARFCRTKGQIGTQYVKLASTFLGPDEHFLADWEVAKPAPIAGNTGGTTRFDMDQMRRDLGLPAWENAS